MAYETFGAALREKRKEAGVSQRTLAKQIDVDFSYISKLENDRLPPPAADTVVKICQILGAEPDELLALTGKFPSQVQEQIGSSGAAQRFLREAQTLHLSGEEWGVLTDKLKSLRNDDNVTRK